MYIFDIIIYVYLHDGKSIIRKQITLTSLVYLLLNLENYPIVIEKPISAKIEFTNITLNFENLVLIF